MATLFKDEEKITTPLKSNKKNSKRCDVQVLLSLCVVFTDLQFDTNKRQI